MKNKENEQEKNEKTSQCVRKFESCRGNKVQRTDMRMYRMHRISQMNIQRCNEMKYKKPTSNLSTP
ncbi:hypothetical protein AXF22_10800 [Prevotella scopos JCM 17725]|nr:hypothetical protein AXF22_10800 [Prevotella scopos JCM 17725]